MNPIANRAPVRAPLVEHEGDVMRLACPRCYARAAVRCTDREWKTEIARAWVAAHSGRACARTKREIQRREYHHSHHGKDAPPRRAYRCSRCDRDGHSIRFCAMPRDASEES